MAFLRASVNDADHDPVRLEVEVRPGRHGVLQRGDVGGLPTPTAASLGCRSGGGSYHWQCRSVDCVEFLPVAASAPTPRRPRTFRFPGDPGQTSGEA